MTLDIHVPTPFDRSPAIRLLAKIAHWAIFSRSALCFARRGKLLTYNNLTPPLYEVERGLGGEYMKALRKR